MKINDILEFEKLADKNQSERDQDDGATNRKFLENATMWDVTSDELEGLWKDARFKKILKLLREAWYGQNPDQPRVGTIWLGSAKHDDASWFQINMIFRTDLDEKDVKNIFEVK